MQEPSALSPVADFHGLPMGPVQALTIGLVNASADGVAEAQVAPQLQLASQVVTRAAAQQTRQGFRVGDLNLMISYVDGSELTDLLPTHHVPNAPSWLLGFCNLHGVAVPVIDLANFLRLQVQERFAKPMLLVLSRGADATGVIIDGLPRRLRWNEAARGDIDAAPERARDFLSNAWLLDGELWFDLDIHALLNAFEAALEAA